MSDNLRRYRAIRHALTQAYPTPPTGHFALAALISGIVGGKSTQLPHIATKAPDGHKPESRVKRFARWLDNARILEELYFLPYAEILEAVRKLMSNKSIPYKSLKVWQETDYPVSPFLALPRI